MKIRWIAQALVWSGYFAFNVVLLSQFQGLSVFGLVLSGLLSLLLWIATEGLRAIVLRFDWLVHGGRLTAGLVVLVPLTAAAVQLLVRYGMLALLAAGWIAEPAVVDFSIGATFIYWLNTMLTLVIWMAAWLAFRYFRRYRSGEIQRWRAEAERQQLELDSLRTRLNPHFVFNTLNNLRALINEDPNAARDAVTRLSNTLRHALYHADQDSVTLGDELAVVRDYLALEKLHYEARLEVREEIGSDALEARLPPMLLQLLVENAVKHGVAHAAGTVEIAADVTDSLLRLKVTNPRLPGASERGVGGVGFAYLRALLAQLDRRAGFDLREEDASVVAELRIPQREPTE